MSKARWMIGSLLGAALVLGSIGPAQARPRYGYGGGYHDRYRHYDRGGFGLGDAIGVAALVGAVAVVATSMSRDRQATQDSAPRDPGLGNDVPPPPADGTDYGADIQTPHSDNQDGADVETTSRDGVDTGAEDQWTNACADAARQEASANGGYAEIRRMDDPRAIDGGYNIDGEVETRAAYRDASGTTRRFTCTVKDGRVAEVYLSRDLVSHLD